jgi:hypothetical protein
MCHVSIAAVLVLLAGCGSHSSTVTTKATDANGKKVPSTLAIDTDWFKANIEVPGLELSGSHVDIGGVKLYPESIVRGMKVTANDHDGDKTHRVALDFVSPASPADVVRHLTGQATEAGFALTSTPDPSGSTILEGARHKADGAEHIRFVLRGAGAQTSGTAVNDGSGSSDG